VAIIRPALICRLYKAIEQRRLTDVTFLLTQLFDTEQLNEDERGSLFLRELRLAAEDLQADGRLLEAEEHYMLALALYDRFFVASNFEAIATTRRLCELLAQQGREGDLAFALDQGYVIVRRMSKSESVDVTLLRYGAIADAINARHQSICDRQRHHRVRVAEGQPVPIPVLHIEQGRDEADIVMRALIHAENELVQLEHVGQLSDALNRLVHGGIDLVLLNVNLPDCESLDALDALRSVRERSPRVPVVVLAGIDDRELAMRAMRTGARDYLVRNRADASVVLRSIFSAIDHPTTVVADSAVLATIQFSPLPMMHFNLDFTVDAVNASLKRLIGRDWTGSIVSEVWPQFSLQGLLSASEYGDGIEMAELPLSTTSGDIVVDAAVWPVGLDTEDREGLIVQLRLR
jgi:CheY-like chemotaxis protein